MNAPGGQSVPGSPTQMQKTQPAKRKPRPLDYVIIILCAALICVVTNVLVAGIIAIPVQLIHKLTYGPR